MTFVVPINSVVLMGFDCLMGNALIFPLTRSVFLASAAIVCGLMLHVPDAVHCKHCGTTINIATESVY